MQPHGHHLEMAAKHSSEVNFPDDWYRVDTARYYSREFQDIEREALWKRVWQVACRSDDVAGPGDWIEYPIGRQSFVIVRDQAGKARAFYNACRHRGNQLCSGQGHGARSLTCKFHLWSYGLDGQLRAVPDVGTFVPFDKKKYGLAAVNCGEWGGFVFINPDPEAAPLTDFVAPIAPYLDAYGIADMTPSGINATYRVACNWKAGIDGFIEAYHIKALHPKNLPMVNDLDQRYVFFDKHSMAVVPAQPSPRLGNLSPEQVIESFGVMERVYRGEDAENPLEKLVAPYRDSSGTLALPEGIDLRYLIRNAVREEGLREGLDYSTLTEDQLTDYHLYSLFPNVVLTMRPNAITYLRFRPDPNGDPESCLWDSVSLRRFADPKARRDAYTPNTMPPPEQSMGYVLDQDREMLPRQQIGLRSDGIDHVLLSKQEAMLVHLHRSIDDCITSWRAQRDGQSRAPQRRTS